jgi:uncharacterized membrane protein
MASFQYSKNLAMEGAILLTLGVIPYVGWALGIIGIILLLRAMKEFANYYQDNALYQNSLTGVKYYIVALIALTVAAAGLVVGLVVIGVSSVSVGNVLAVSIGAAFLVIAVVFFIVANLHLRKALDALAQKTGEHSFATAAMLLWVGALLSIIVIGFLLILLAWIFAVVGFFSIRSPQQQTQYTYPPPPQTTLQMGQTARYCPNCGSPVTADATYCPHCGKPLTT